jgi:acetyl-CoA acetyltransferase family protein
MSAAYICDAVRTPIGRYGGALSSVRTDDLGAIPIAALAERNASLDPAAIEDIAYGCANQAGEDNRNVARMSALLAGIPVTVPAATVNRLCGSGMNALGNVADAIRTGGIELAIAGGVESMSRAPFVLGKQSAAFGRDAELHDTTLGWRFVNRKLEEQYGIDSMAETAENVASEFEVSREDQDHFALRSQQRAGTALANNVFDDEIVPVTVPQKRGDSVIVDTDEHPRAGSTIEGLAKLRPIVRKDGSITAGNASGINDGACALLIASEDARYSSHPKMPRASRASSRSRGLLPGRPPASNPASWASDRCRPQTRCSGLPGWASGRWMS